MPAEGALLMGRSVKRSSSSNLLSTSRSNSNLSRSTSNVSLKSKYASAVDLTSHYRLPPIKILDLKLVFQSLCRLDLLLIMPALSQIRSNQHLYQNRWNRLTFEPKILQQIVLEVLQVELPPRPHGKPVTPRPATSNSTQNTSTSPTTEQVTSGATATAAVSGQKAGGTTSVRVAERDFNSDILSCFESDVAKPNGLILWALFQLLNHSQPVTSTGEPIDRLDRTTLFVHPEEGDVLPALLVLVTRLALSTKHADTALSVLRVLRCRYGVSNVELFQLLDDHKSEIATRANDSAVMGFLHFSTLAAVEEPAALPAISSFFVSAIMHMVFHCDTYYALSRVRPLFHLVFAPFRGKTALENVKSLSAQDIRAIGNIVIMCRYLSCYNETNREFFASEPFVGECLAYACSPDAYDYLVKEILHLVNIIYGDPKLRSRIPKSSEDRLEALQSTTKPSTPVHVSASTPVSTITAAAVAETSNELISTGLWHLSLKELRSIVRSDMRHSLDALIDTYIMLFESTFVFSDADMCYNIGCLSSNGGTSSLKEASEQKKVMDPEHEEFLNAIFTITLDWVEEAISAYLQEPFLKEQSDKKKNAALLASSATSLYRLFFKLERNFRVSSDHSSFLTHKLRTIEVMSRIVESPDSWPVAALPLFDTLVILFRGVDSLWQGFYLGKLDRQLINTSLQLEFWADVWGEEQKMKMFDAKDRESWDYLVGKDGYNRIHDMFCKNAELDLEMDDEMRSGSMSESVQDAPVWNGEDSGYCMDIDDEPIDIEVAPPTHNSSPPQLLSRKRMKLLTPRQPTTSQVAPPFYVREAREFLEKIVHFFLPYISRLVVEWDDLTPELRCRGILNAYLTVQLLGYEVVALNMTDMDRFITILWGILGSDLYGVLSVSRIDAPCIWLLSTLVENRLRILHMKAGSEADVNIGNVFPEGMHFSECIMSILRLRPEVVSYTITRASNENSDSTEITIDDEEAKKQGILWAPYDLNMDLHCVALNSLHKLAQYDSQIRKKLLQFLPDFLTLVPLYASFDPINFSPCLVILQSLVSFMPKLELHAEEKIVELLIRCLRDSRAYTRAFACEVIYEIGGESPGFIFRGLSRREIEDPILELLQTTAMNTTDSTHTGPLDLKDVMTESNTGKQYTKVILHALKALTVLLHNFNIRPVWIPSPYLYHWSTYGGSILDRPILRLNVIPLTFRLLKSVDVSYRLTYFTYFLAFTTCLMYACSDGSVCPSTENEQRHLQALKEAAIRQVVPCFPLALDFIMLLHKKRQQVQIEVQEATNQHRSAPAARLSNITATIPSNGPNPKMSSRVSSLGLLSGAVSSNLTQRNSVNFLREPEVENSLGWCLDDVPTIDTLCSPSRPIALDILTEMGLLEGESRRGRFSRVTSVRSMALISQQGIDPNTLSSSALAALRSISHSTAITFLTEKTIDGLFAFLCTDEMFPLSTYNQFLEIFNHKPLISTLAALLLAQNETKNAVILRKGLDILKYFADHEVELSSISLHAPPALLFTVRALREVAEVQISFCKIVQMVALMRRNGIGSPRGIGFTLGNASGVWTDTEACDNLLRFRVQDALVEMLEARHKEAARAALQALYTLTFREEHMAWLMREPPLPRDFQCTPTPLVRPTQRGKPTKQTTDTPVMRQGQLRQATFTHAPVQMRVVNQITRTKVMENQGQLRIFDAIFRILDAFPRDLRIQFHALKLLAHFEELFSAEWRELMTPPSSKYDSSDAAMQSEWREAIRRGKKYLAAIIRVEEWQWIAANHGQDPLDTSTCCFAVFNSTNERVIKKVEVEELLASRFWAQQDKCSIM